MNKTRKNLLSVFGAISLIFGAAVLFPSYSDSSFIGLGVSFILIILGVILLAFAFGD